MRKNNIFKVAIFLLFLVPTMVGAQSLSPLNAHLQAVRVGLVDEFFDRFNGSAVHPDISSQNDESRKNNLLALLNFAQFTSKEDSLFKEASAMMDTVINDSVQINFSDTTWVAIAHCIGKLEGRNVKIDLYLTIQHRKLDMYKWVIAKVDGDLFGIAPKNDDDRIMLNPDSHETNFISLRRATNDQPHNIERFMSRSFDYDATSVFTYLVYNKKLKIDFVDELEFVFTQIPGYIFHVTYFDRESVNTGWLISNLYKSSQEDKDAFLCSLHSRITHEDLIADTSAKVNSRTNEDSVMVSNGFDFRDMFIARTSEKIAQLIDLLSILSNKHKLNSQMFGYLKEKVITLFADSAMIHIRYPDNSIKFVNVSSFCEMLKRKTIACESLDSICIPAWNNIINALPPDVKTINLPSVKYSVAKLRRNPYNPEGLLTSCYQSLFAYKMNTELGEEWVPILGDLVVSVKWSKDKNKSKRK